MNHAKMYLSSMETIRELETNTVLDNTEITFLRDAIDACFFKEDDYEDLQKEAKEFTQQLYYHGRILEYQARILSLYFSEIIAFAGKE